MGLGVIAANKAQAGGRSEDDAQSPNLTAEALQCDRLAVEFVRTLEFAVLDSNEGKHHQRTGSAAPVHRSTGNRLGFECQCRCAVRSHGARERPGPP